MFKDARTGWEGGFPYDLLGPAGITPTSSLAAVRDVAFTLMASAPMTPDMRRAWDALRRPDRRLAVDFFLYRAAYPRLIERDDSGEQP